MGEYVTSGALLLGVIVGYVLGRLSDKKIICVPQGTYELMQNKEKGEKQNFVATKNPFNDAVRRYFYPKPRIITIKE